MTVDITVPALGESVTEATVMRWNKQPGDAVVLDETLVELETDKIAVEVKAEAAGTLAEIAAGEGTDVEVGALLGRLETGDAAAVAPEPEPQVSRMLLNVSPPPSPAVRRLLDEHGLDPTEIEGTGKGGRLLKSDVLAAVVARAASAATPAGEPPPPEPSPEPVPSGDPPPAPSPPDPAPAQPAAALAKPEDPREERVPMSRLRRRAGERLKLAQDTAAMLTTFNEVDMTAVTALRAAHGGGVRAEARRSPRPHVLLRQGGRLRARRVPDGQRADRRRRHRLQALPGHRRRRERPPGPRGAGASRRRAAGLRRGRAGDPRLRPQGPPTASSPSTTCSAAPSPSPTAGSSARSCPRRSSTRRSPRSSACTRCRSARSPSQARWKSAP